MSELRYHPFLDQWVITATHRQDRTFLPPADFNPLAPSIPGKFPTEIPFADYDIVVFENKFPSLQFPAPAPVVNSHPIMPVLPAEGICEVIAYTSDSNATFAELPFHQVRKLTRVWKERYIDLSSKPFIEYVFIFENKGKEIGVTLFHPHGQIYAYPFIPPIPKTEIAQELSYFSQHRIALMGSIIQEAIAENRVIWQSDTFVAFVPGFARYPYEVYVVPREHKASLEDFNPMDLDGLAEALLVVTRKYDRLFDFSMPYIMAMHQAPCRSKSPAHWFHVEFYPPYRTANKLKYLAGSEAGVGAFINDTLPEETAATLREIALQPLH